MSKENVMKESYIYEHFHIIVLRGQLTRCNDTSMLLQLNHKTVVTLSLLVFVSYSGFSHILQ